jgi:hypothetical protein
MKQRKKHEIVLKTRTFASSNDGNRMETLKKHLKTTVNIGKHSRIANSDVSIF